MEKLDKRRRAAGAPGVWCIRLPASPALVRRHRMQSVGGVWGDGRTVSAPVAFRRQARALAGAFLGQGEGGGTSVTAALFLAGAVLAAVVSLLEFVLGDHWLLYLLTTALLLLPPFFGTDTELAPVLLLALFQLAFWGLRMAGTAIGRRRTTAACSLIFRTRWAGGPGGPGSMACFPVCTSCSTALQRQRGVRSL